MLEGLVSKLRVREEGIHYLVELATDNHWRGQDATVGLAEVLLEGLVRLSEGRKLGSDTPRLVASSIDLVPDLLR